MKTKLQRVSDVIQGTAIGSMIISMIVTSLLFDPETLLLMVGWVGSINTIIQTILWIWRNTINEPTG